MNYHTSAHWARAISLLVSGLVGGSYGLHLFETSGNVLIAATFGILFTAVVAGVWHVLLHFATEARRWSTRSMLLGFGLIMTVGAIVVSGRAVTTLIGGEAALKSQQAAILPDFDEALTGAHNAVIGQEALVGAVMKAATQTGMRADEEGRSGQGPLYRDLRDNQRMFREASEPLRETLASAGPLFQSGSDALDAARASLGDEAAFDLAITEVAAAIRGLNAINIAPQIEQIGVVTSKTGELDAITQALHSAARRASIEPVQVPNTSRLSASDAIALGDGTWGFWFTSAFIESVPLLFLILLMISWREPLLREQQNPEFTSDNEIRTREDDVKGLRVVAE